MLGWVAETTLVAAVLALVALGIGRSRCVTVETRHALWVVVLIKFLLPPVVAWPRVEWDPPAAPVAFAREPAAAPDPASVSILNPDPPLVPNPRPEPPIAVGMDEAGVGVTRFDWTGLALAVWGGGSLVVGAWGLARVIRFRRRLDQASDAPMWLVAEVAGLAVRFAVRPPRVLVVPGVVSPLLWCLGRPRLVVPEGWDRLSPEARSSLIAHELAHLSRQDHWVVRLELILSLVWWWNPVFRLARRRVRDEAELACDARVVRAWADGRLSYAEALINVCEQQSRLVPPAPALGVGGSRAARTLEARLKMILRDPVRPPTRWAGPLALILLGLSLPTWTRGQQDPARPAQPAVPVNPPPALDPDPGVVAAADPAPPVVEPPDKPVPPAVASTPVKVLKAQRATQVAEVARVEAVRDKVKIEFNKIMRLHDGMSHAVTLTEVNLHRAELRNAEATVAREQSKIAEIDAQLDPDGPVAPPSDRAVLQARRDAQASWVKRVEAELHLARAVAFRYAKLIELDPNFVSKEEQKTAEFNLAAAEATVAREQAKLAEANVLLAQAKSSPATKQGTAEVGPGPIRSLADWRDQVELLDLQASGKREAVDRATRWLALADQQLSRVQGLVDRGAIAMSELNSAVADQADRSKAVGIVNQELREAELRLNRRDAGFKPRRPGSSARPSGHGT